MASRQEALLERGLGKQREDQQREKAKTAQRGRKSAEERGPSVIDVDGGAGSSRCSTLNEEKAIWEHVVGAFTPETFKESDVARVRNSEKVALTMAAFCIGAAVPLIAIGLLSREALSRWRGRLMEAGKGGKVCSAEC